MRFIINFVHFSSFSYQMIDIEKEAKEIEESQPGKEEVDEDIKPAELEGINIYYKNHNIFLNNS